MEFANINYVAVMLAAAAGFLFGGVWYGLLSQQWMEAAGMTMEDVTPSNEPVLAPYISAFLAELVMAFILAGVIGGLVGGPGQTIWQGMLSGALMWLGFIMSSLVVNHAFQGVKKALTFIDGGHWLGVMLVQGAVLGWLGSH
ncbi:MAG TPA: DUF1761 domain-containing protein [Hyphomicrobiaceae bacterium]|nr:DUF1761 domain-containing protein [Hyphomicrobiaceae bacterium]